MASLTDIIAAVRSKTTIDEDFLAKDPEMAPSPPVISQRRRLVDSSTDDNERPTARRRYSVEDQEEYLDQLSEMFSLNSAGRGALKDFAELETIRAMLIYTQAMYLSIQEQQHENILATFLESTEWRNHIVPRCKAVLIAPDLCAYKAGVAKHVLKDMKRRPKEWKIPLNLLDDHRGWKSYRSKVKKKFTDLRSDIRLKLDVSIPSKESIYALVRNIAGTNVVLHKVHFARWAFVRAAYVEYCEQVKGGIKPARQFWESLDAHLAELRKKAPEVSNAELGSVTHDIFKRVLTIDLQLYPTTERFKKAGRVPGWQSDMAAIMDSFTPADGEVADEDDVSEEESDGDRQASSSVD